jgi:hypothetical protein
MLKLEKYSVGCGDRFARQAKAQLSACQEALAAGVEVIPVWNKSHREHATVGSLPPTVRAAASKAVAEAGWTRGWHVDADHINLGNVEGFLDSSDFFTIDVAAAIGGPVAPGEVGVFVDRHSELIGEVAIEGVTEPIRTSRDAVAAIAAKYLSAVAEAGRIYRHIEARKGAGNFITEVSMDETDSPQTPPELLVILAAIADEKIPAQTIAPKFTGRFNKGVDYVGDVAQFEKEFRDDLAVIAHAVRHYPLEANLKLSVHSGSDKFSIYGPIHRAIAASGAGVHLKTAGTTWLEEIIGLAEAGGEGLALAKQIYRKSFADREALCAPYAAVVDIDPARLPAPDAVDVWPPEEFVAALRHDPANPAYNLHLRQLLHVGYKVAAKLGPVYLNLLEACEPTIARNVKTNLWDRHIKPVFLG